MSKEIIRQEFRLKNKEETRNDLIKETDRSEFMSNKYKKHCTTLNCIEHFSYFSCWSYWICLNFWFCFFTWYYYRNYKFFNRINKLCSKYKN